MEHHLLTMDNSRRADAVHVLACSHSQIQILITIPFLWLSVLESKSDPESDSKPNRYIVLCRTCSHCTDLDSYPCPYFCTGKESESESLPGSMDGNVNEPLQCSHLVCSQNQKRNRNLDSAVKIRHNTD